MLTPLKEGVDFWISVFYFLCYFLIGSLFFGVKLRSIYLSVNYLLLLKTTHPLCFKESQAITFCCSISYWPGTKFSSNPWPAHQTRP